MERVTVYRVGIADLAALGSGSDAVAATLAALAAEAFPPPKRGRHTGTLDRLGPVSRYPVGGPPVVRPGVPTRREVDAVAHGLPVPPERAAAAWALVELWLAHVATATGADAVGVRPDEWAELELPFDLPPGLHAGVRLTGDEAEVMVSRVRR